MDTPDFGKMIGPLPLGAWLGVVGGGIGLMYYQRQQSAGSDAGYTGTADTTGTVEEWEDISVPPGVGTGGWSYTPPQSDTGSVTGDPDTNEGWARRAVNGLIALGYDPAVSDSAVRKYMEAGQLGASEYALITIALGKYGAPPVLLPAPVFGPPTMPNTSGGAGKPVAVQTPKPVKKPGVRYYIVKPGQTLSGIAKRHGTTWQAVYNANKKGKKRADGTPGMISNPDRIQAGWRLILP